MKDTLGSASARKCQRCSSQANDWAYDQLDRDEFIAEVKVFNGYRHYNLTLAYSTKPEHYQPLCRRCHRAQDMAYRGQLEELLLLV